jgi:hypothetical protein
MIKSEMPLGKLGQGRRSQINVLFAAWLKRTQRKWFLPLFLAQMTTLVLEILSQLRHSWLKYGEIHVGGRLGSG